MMIPFLKWAGGKRWLIYSEQLKTPKSFNKYIEPFLGGGAVFFHLKPARSILTDINPDLIELYQVIRENPVGFQRLLGIHHALHNKDLYYNTRSERPNSPLERAVRTLYLNRTCWNGLYRVNLKGEFNVPIGTKSSVVFDYDNFTEISNTLNTADIYCSDFENTIEKSQEGDFLFIDPPYTVQHNLNGFIKYNEKIFNWADQIRLRDAVKRAISRNVSIVLTNADHESVRTLYKGVCEYTTLIRSSVLAGDANRRGRTSEAMFTANL